MEIATNRREDEWCEICLLHGESLSGESDSLIPLKSGESVHISCLVWFYENFEVLSGFDPEEALTGNVEWLEERGLLEEREAREKAKSEGALKRAYEALLDMYHGLMRKTHQYRKENLKLKDEVEELERVISVLKDYGFRWDKEREEMNKRILALKKRNALLTRTLIRVMNHPLSPRHLTIVPYMETER